eukprot:tig00021569_g22349.t1
MPRIDPGALREAPRSPESSDDEGERTPVRKPIGLDGHLKSFSSSWAQRSPDVLSQLSSRTGRNLAAGWTAPALAAAKASGPGRPVLSDDTNKVALPLRTPEVPFSAALHEKRKLSPRSLDEGCSSQRGGSSGAKFVKAMISTQEILQTMQQEAGKPLPIVLESLRCMSKRLDAYKFTVDTSDQEQAGADPSDHSVAEDVDPSTGAEGDAGVPSSGEMSEQYAELYGAVALALAHGQDLSSLL